MIDRLLRKVRRKDTANQFATPQKMRSGKDKKQKNRTAGCPRGQRQLTKEQIEAGEHRQKVGGAWEEIGRLQLDFLKERGLQPHHKLLDIGCGALRGGIHFVRYLNAGNYHGLDIEPSLIEAGRFELSQASLSGKGAYLLVDSRFSFGRFRRTFDYAVAISLFTHLNLNQIALCLARLRPYLTGEFYASFFEAPYPVHLEAIEHPRTAGRPTLTATPTTTPSPRWRGWPGPLTWRPSWSAIGCTRGGSRCSVSG